MLKKELKIRTPALRNMEVGVLKRYDLLTAARRREIDTYSVAKLDTLLPRYNDTPNINYTGSPIVHVASTVVYCEPEVLILKRSDKVSTDRGKWSFVDGLIDNARVKLTETARRELDEELGWGKVILPSLIESEVKYTYKDGKRIWVVHPLLQLLTSKPSVWLNDENSAYAWVKWDELSQYKRVVRCNPRLLDTTLQAGDGQVVPVYM